ncbi:SAM-dependent methyltransferase, partial [Verrucosispora sp. SN26_14.1]
MNDDNRVTRRRVGDAEIRRANRHWWDTDADAYQAEHGAFLGDVDFVWCPEGLREADARLLGEVAGRRVLEVGCGAASCA